MVGRDAVRQAVGTAGVFRDVAAYRAHLLARGVGSEVKAVAGDRVAELEVHEAGLDDGDPVLDVDLQNARHAGQRDYYAALTGDCAPAQTRAGAPGDDRRSMGSSGVDNQRNVLR